MNKTNNKYVIVTTWNGDGYSSENKVVEVIELDSDKTASYHCKKVMHTNETIHDEEQVHTFDNGCGWTTDNDDSGSYQWFKLKEDSYGISVECNVNEVKLLTKKEYEESILELLKDETPQCMDEHGVNWNTCTTDKRLFISADLHDYKTEMDMQFEIIDTEIKPNVDNLEWFDGGDGVEFETWKDTTTGKLYMVPIEIVRDFDGMSESEYTI